MRRILAVSLLAPATARLLAQLGRSGMCFDAPAPRAPEYSVRCASHRLMPGGSSLHPQLRGRNGLLLGLPQLHIPFLGSPNASDRPLSGLWLQLGERSVQPRDEASCLSLGNLLVLEICEVCFCNSCEQEHSCKSHTSPNRTTERERERERETETGAEMARHGAVVSPSLQ